MPVIFNEPLSFLQRIVEYMEYATLLSKAAMCDDPMQRLEVGAFLSVLKCEQLLNKRKQNKNSFLSFILITKMQFTRNMVM